MDPDKVRIGLISPEVIQERLGTSLDQVQQLIDLVAGWYDRAMTGFNDPVYQEMSWNNMLWYLKESPEHVPLLIGTCADHPTIGRATFALRLDGFVSSYLSLTAGGEEVRSVWRNQVILRTVFQLVQFCTLTHPQPDWFTVVLEALDDPTTSDVNDWGSRIIAGLQLATVEVFVTTFVLPLVLAGRFSE